jgi:hypothetical protein
MKTMQRMHKQQHNAKNENRNMMRRTKIKEMKKFMTKMKHTQTSLLLAKKTYQKKKTKTLT